MKNLSKIFGIIALTVLATLLIQRYWPKPKSDPSIKYGQLQSDQTMSLVKQTNEYSDLDATYRWRILGRTKIYCQWVGVSRFGIDIPKDWKWNLKYNERSISVTAPPLKLIDVNNQPSVCENIKRGGLVDNAQFRNDKEKEFQLKSEEKAKVLLNSDDLVQLARLSLESQLLNILQQANPEVGLLKVNVIFANK